MHTKLVNFFRVLISWKVDVEVLGTKNMPQEGPILVVFNHASFLDVVATLFSIRKNLKGFVAFKYRFIPPVVLFWVFGSVIFVKRGMRDLKALQKAQTYLSNGGIFMLASEGARGGTDILQKGKWGAAYLAAITNAWVVPLGVQNSQNIANSVRYNLFNRKKFVIKTIIGTPFKVQISDNLLMANIELAETKTAWANITNDQIMPKLAKIIPSNMRGEFI